MLDAARKKSVAGQLMGHAPFVLKFHGDGIGAGDLPADLRERQAAPPQVVSGMPETTLSFGFARTSGMKRSSGVARRRFPRRIPRPPCADPRHTSCKGRPTCCAARPMPPASCIVATISLASWVTRIKRDNFSPLVRKTGSL